MKHFWPFALLLMLSCSSGEKNIPPEVKSKTQSAGDVLEIHLPMEDTVELTTKALESGAESKNGPIKVYYESGKLKAQGNLLNGKKSGLWTSYYPNGKMWSRTAYYSGLASGASVTYYENGQIKFVGDYKDGKRTGMWKFYQEDGTLIKEVNF